MKRFSLLSFVCALVLFSQVSWGQQVPSGPGCSLPAPPFASSKANIFSVEQEQWLGDAQASEVEPYYDLLPDKDSAELERIGQKLLAQLPPTAIHYRFRVYESEDANGFSLAGGYVYVSRKLITDAHSEDEVAGVLAHEIGHIYTHQIAIAYTRELKALLNVTSLKDRDDVEDKAQLALNAPWKDKAEESEEAAEKDELLADRVGLYAMTRAGYAPRAFAENLDRVTANKGRTGNFLTDLMDSTGEIALRVRMARKAADSLPAECKQLTPGFSASFKQFQESIRNAMVHPLIEPTPGLASFKLNPPMRPALEQVKISPNGAYVLAQDEYSIHVLSRTPLKHLFSIDARGAELASFTPDSTHVSFHYQTMRVELWDIAAAKRESYHELIDYEGCPQTSLSPDGKTFVCLAKTSDGVWLKLTDVETGKRFYDNKKFNPQSYLGARDIVVRLASGLRVGTVVYSQDGKTMLIVTGAKAMAYDLAERKPILLGHDLVQLTEGRMAFVDSNKLVYECDTESKTVSSTNTFKMCEATFPEGLPLNSFKLGYQWVEPVTRGNHVLIGPFKENAAMLTDPSNGTASAGFKLNSLDMYDQVLATENESGGVTVGELGGPHMFAIDLPVSPMTGVEAAAFSPDGRFLAYSGKARSSIWDLETQKRVALMRPFRGVRFNEQDMMFAQYKESQQKPGQNYQIDLKTGKATEGAKFATDQFQHGEVLVTFQPIEKTGEVGSNIDLQVADAATGATLWSKRYLHESPLVRQSEDGTLLLIVDLLGESATWEAKHAGTKPVKSSDTKSELVSQGLLIEVVDSHTGELKRFIQTPERSGSGGARTAALYGSYLVVHGAANNSVIYRVADGVRTGAFYGRAIAGDGKLGLIAATNRDQDVILYDAATGKELKRVTVDQFPRAARFIAEKNALLVLTANQRVYTIDLPAAGHAEGAQDK
jgi:hypothetical protein